MGDTVAPGATVTCTQLQGVRGGTGAAAVSNCRATHARFVDPVMPAAGWMARPCAGASHSSVTSAWVRRRKEKPPHAPL